MKLLYLSFLSVFVFLSNPLHAHAQVTSWAFEETFSGVPTSPSQSLLPKTFDYTVTHRRDSGGQMPDQNRGSFPADHSMSNCEFDDAGTMQHSVTTGHAGDATNPDQSFFICKDHMMSSMGHVAGYSVSSFWPRQEFDFSNGGTLEFDVNINGNPGRSWWEILIAPRNQIKAGAAEDWLPIDETYPKERIVLTFSERQARKMKVGTGSVAPKGWIAEQNDWRENGTGWLEGDPAKTNRRLRRKNRITITNNKIVWSIQKQDGSFDDVTLNIPAGLPFKKGLVLFKTHAYTPEKDGNRNLYTYHWDNIRFSGPKIHPYLAYEYNGIVNLERNGDTPIGTQQTVSINLPKVGSNPILFGQVEGPKVGQVLVSVNGNPDITIRPHDVTCDTAGWSTFFTSIPASQLKVGANTLKWTVGPKPACDTDNYPWNGYGVKALELQFDGDGTNITSAPLSPTPLTISPTASVSLTPTRIPTVNQQNSRLMVTVLLHGLGRGGDNINPQSTGTMNPLRPQRQVLAEVFNAANQPIGTKEGVVTFNSAGSFSGVIDAGNLSAGYYTLKIKVPYYLKKTVPGIISVIAGQQTSVQAISLTAGDTNNDNVLDVRDINMVLDCFSDFSPAKNCDPAKKAATDLTDDGNVNQFDYNFLLRELSVQAGE